MRRGAWVWVAVGLLVGGVLVGAGTRRAEAATGNAVHVWLSTADGASRLAQQGDVTLGAVSTGGTNVVVDDARTFQTMAGFGAAFTDSSTYLLGSTMNDQQRAAALSALFDPVNGIGLSFMRLPMAASDYTACRCSYSYDDLPAGQSDPSMSRFSVDHDRAYTIPVLKQAMALNPALRIFANPWSPPAWMKTNGSMVARVNGGTPGTLIDADQDALAAYFVKFLQAYQAAGVPIWGITPQNEPGVLTTDYPGEDWPAAKEAAFVSGHLLPALRNAGLSPAVLGYDSNWETPDYARTLLADPGTAAGLAGIAWHGYAGDPAAMTSIVNQSSVDAYETECSTPFCHSERAVQLTMDAVQNQARGVVLWNLALDPSGQPKQGTGCINCNGLVTVDQGSYSATDNYVGLGHFSKFVKPGAVRIGATQLTDGVSSAAFRNPDGTEVLVAYNSSSSSRGFTITWNQRGSVGYSLPAGAIATFVAQPGAAPLPQTTYSLVNRATGQVLSTTGGGTANGTKLVTAADGDAATQHWALSPTGDGYYRFATVAGRVLDDTGFSTSAGTQMQIWDPATGNLNQQWWAQTTSQGYVSLVNRQSGLVLTASGSTVVQALPGGTAGAQEWRLVAVPTAGTSYHLVNRNSGKALGIPGGTTNPGDFVEQFHDSGNPDQSWTLNPTSGGYVTARNAGSGLVAGVLGSSQNASASVVQWGANGNSDQEWLPVRSGAWVRFTDRNSGQELGVSGASLSDAAQAVQWPHNGAADHDWALVPLGPRTVQPVVARPVVA